MLAVEVHNLAKRYRLGGAKERGYKTLRDTVSHLFSRRNGRESAATLWALQDVSFEVAEGEALGVIGRNGAGKSTLLKILSRITEPTLGRARLHGRVASLLEVGTGFHPELTGRENIYLNGAILGMTRAEIRRDFDAIVAFAEMDQFLDTPVKRYSSGMQMRLAFAVAAHLTPEILIVDEVLAVGDYEFQRRCLGQMNKVAHSGRTVLFVSHNMTAIEELCTRTILLRNGRLERAGPTHERGIPSHKIVIVPNWVDVGRVRPLDGENRLRKAWGLDGRFVVMYSGNLGLSQNLEQILLAARELRGAALPVHFLFVGEGAAKARLEAQALEWSLDNVSFRPYQAKDALSESLGVADVHLIPLQKGLAGCIVPSKLYGILAAGKPYIAAVDADSEVARITDAEKTGLVIPPDDAAELVAAVRWCVKHPDELPAMGRRGRQVAESTFDRGIATASFERVVCDAGPAIPAVFALAAAKTPA